MSDRSKKAVIGLYVDEGYVPPDKWTATAVSLAEVRRLKAVALMACYAAEFPRRLGPDADGGELAADKALSRGIAHTYWKLWRRLTESVIDPEDLDESVLPPTSWYELHVAASRDEDARRAGATVLWTDWWTEVKPRVMGRRAAVATFAWKRELWGWGYRVVAGLCSELEWVQKKFDRAEELNEARKARQRGLLTSPRGRARPGA